MRPFCSRPKPRHSAGGILVVLLAAALVLCGCNSKQPADPNDPAKGSLMQAEVMQRNLRWASEFLSERTLEGQISRRDADQKLEEYAAQLASSIPNQIQGSDDAWRYGEVLRTAKLWDRAREAFKLAADIAKTTKNADRFVNDKLHYAEALAHLGDTKAALEAVRSTFTASPENKAPILYSTLYELAPAITSPEEFVELAKLLEEAIGQHMQVIVDPSTDAGVSFITTRAHHIARAWDKIQELYRRAGRADLADQAMERKANMPMGSA